LFFVEYRGGGEESLEEVPALLVVVLGLSIFILSIAQAYVAYAVQAEQMRGQELVRQFATSINSYEEITWDWRPGVFDSVKLATLPDEAVLREFNPESLGFQYQITVVDVSSYSCESRDTYRLNSSQMPLGDDVYTTVWPAIVRHNAEEYHAAQLIVSMWE
jgi:hypothetical protein